MRKLISLTLMLILIFAALPALAVTSAIGEAVPDFTVTTTDGESITLSESLEKYQAVIINFWHVNCGWCKYEFPFLEEYYQSAGEDVLVLALNPYDSKESISTYKEKLGLSFPMASDANVINLFSVSSFPTTVIIDKDGIFRAFEAGAKASKEDFEAMLSPYVDTPKDAADEASPREGVYTIKFIDQNGAPVTGITAQICDDSTCNLLAPNADGILKFKGEVHSYELHLLEIPDGYSFDLDTIVPLTDGDIDYTVELTKLDDHAQVPTDNQTNLGSIALIAISAAIITAAVTVIVIINRKTKG